MTAEEYHAALEQAQLAGLVLFALLLMLSAYVITLPEHERICKQHRKPESQCWHVLLFYIGIDGEWYG